MRVSCVSHVYRISRDIRMGMWSCVSAQRSSGPQNSTLSSISCVAKVRSITEFWLFLLQIVSFLGVSCARSRRSISISRWSAACSHATPVPPHLGWCALKSSRRRTSPCASERAFWILGYSVSLGPPPLGLYTLIIDILPWAVSSSRVATFGPYCLRLHCASPAHYLYKKENETQNFLSYLLI